jgi:hypothetical protein
LIFPLPATTTTMARIFNIYFSYNGQLQNAMVSVRYTPFYTEYTLNNFNEELLPFLPGNKIISKAPDHFIFPNTSDQNSGTLMDAIIRAVSEHLHATEA